MDQRFLSYLLDIQTELENLWPLIDFYNSQSGLNDYSAPIGAASRVVEKIIILIANERGCEYNDGKIANGNDTSKSGYITPYQLILKGYVNDIPSEVCAYLNYIVKCRDRAVHGISITYPEELFFAEAFDCFVSWFLINSSTFRVNNDPEIQKVRSRFDSFKKKITVDIRSDDGLDPIVYEIVPSISQTQRVVDSGKDLENKNEEVLTKLDSALNYLEKIDNGLISVQTKIDQISEKLEVISRQITDYQSLLARQIDMAITESEIERIMSAFTDECTSRIVREVKGDVASKAYDSERDRLISSLGEDAWNKLDQSSQCFLITAKVTYNNLLELKDVIDYSGVCLLVTKAVEVEMSNRFCRDFLIYLKEKYPGKDNFAVYPTTLLNKYGKPIKSKDFTLGSVAYVLCNKFAEGISDEQIDNNENKLIEFVSERLMKGVDVQSIKTNIDSIAEGVESIRIDYRNPSAHTNSLQQINARECFDLVLDVEKILKSILNSLDY